MKKVSFILLIMSFLVQGCSKNNNSEPNPETILSDKTLVIDKDISSISLIEVDSTKVIFAATGTDLSKIKVGSILVSDVTDKAPNGFLRKVISISNANGKITYETVQASLTDAIEKGSISFKKTFTDNDIIGIDSSGVDISISDKSKSAQMPSFSFSYRVPLYDSDQKKETYDDQIYIEGEIKLEPTFYFDLDIDLSKIKYFRVQLDLKNTNSLKAIAKVTLPLLRKEIVLRTFPLKPYTILVAGVPVPIAKQWIVIVVGIDGNISAKMICGAQNINTAKAGIIYENKIWDVFAGMENSFELIPITFEGEAKIEPWLQARYEIRPYALQQSRIFIGVKGAVIGEAKTVATGLDLSLKWGVKLTAKAQMVIFDQSIFNYENDLYTNEFPIKQWSSFAFPTVSTNAITAITQITATCGGNVTSDGGATVTSKGVCWNTTGTPTTADSKTSNGTGAGSFTSNLTGLTANTPYYVRAYATNSQGTAYGNQVTFTTSQAIGLPTVTTNSVTDIAQTTANGGGNVTSDGGATVTAKGVCWNTTGTPSTSNFKTTNGTGTGSYTSSLTGLTANTPYFVRAYATNSVGTAYGNQISFTTVASTTYKIGDSFGGGTIFYLDNSGLHGLIAAKTDQSTSIPWYNGSFVYVGATDKTIGAGQANTTKIISVLGQGNYAANLCDNLVLDGYNDWFLPSQNELNEMFSHYDALGMDKIDDYWSSTDSGCTSGGIWGGCAFCRSYGYNSYQGPSSKHRVRAIRKF